jgi:crossover junction endodeoxyribonuclease RuvC
MVGYALLERDKRRIRLLRYGTFRAKGDIPTRFSKIYRVLSRFITSAGADHIVLEKAFYGENVNTAIRMGEARGIAILASAGAGATLFEYPPAQVKRALTGNGRASKAQISSAVRAILGIKDPCPPDASDAIALALYHCIRSC